MIYNDKKFNIVNYLINRFKTNSKLIAEKLNVSPAYISKVYNGKPIGLEFAKKISNAYGIPLTDVLGETQTLKKLHLTKEQPTNELIAKVNELERLLIEKDKMLSAKVESLERLITSKDETIALLKKMLDK